MSEPSAMSVEIARLNVRPGDVIVVKADDHISSKQAEWLRNMFREAISGDVKVIVLDKTLSLSVLTREEIETRAAA